MLTSVIMYFAVVITELEPVLNPAPPQGEAFEHYTRVGASIRNTQADLVSSWIREFVTIDGLEANGNYQKKPFIVFDGPSGIGKTQCAFTLLHSPEFLEKFECRYVPLVYDGMAQAIYCTFQPLAFALNWAVTSDLSRPDADPNLSFNSKTATFWALLFGITTDLSTLITPQKLKAGVDDLRRRTNKGVVVFLDEVPKVNLSTERSLLFLRNLLRVCGVLCVMMGTDSTIANMIEVPAGSRIDDNRTLWCSIISDFPQAHPDTFSPLRRWLS